MLKTYALSTALWRRLGDAVTLPPSAPPVVPGAGVWPALDLYPALTLYPTDAPGLGIGE